MIGSILVKISQLSCMLFGVKPIYLKKKCEIAILLMFKTRIPL